MLVACVHDCDDSEGLGPHSSRATQLRRDPLGGAIAGVVLTNHHTTKLEKLKLEQEKLKRNTEVIEEVYSLLIKIHEHSMKNIRVKAEITNRLENDLGRVKTLSHLYLPTVMSAIDNVFDAQDNLGIAIAGANKERTDEDRKTIAAAFERYNTSLDVAYNELFKLVK